MIVPTKSSEPKVSRKSQIFQLSSILHDSHASLSLITDSRIFSKCHAISFSSSYSSVTLIERVVTYLIPNTLLRMWNHFITCTPGKAIYCNLAPSKTKILSLRYTDLMITGLVFDGRKFILILLSLLEPILIIVLTGILVTSIAQTLRLSKYRCFILSCNPATAWVPTILLLGLFTSIFFKNYLFTTRSVNTD